MFQGGIQAMSRSYFTSIIPAEKTGEYFGIYDIFGKGAGCLGPALVSGCVILVTKLTEAFPSFSSVTAVMNLDLLPIPLLTIAGFIVFYIAAKLPIAKEAIRAKKENKTEEISVQENTGN
jgi:UMF1 family MFS transporter